MTNERFLTKLEERGVNTNTWLSEFPRLVEEVHNIPDGPFKLYFEQDHFRTYPIIENLEKVNSMYRVVNDYCKAFATACGLPLGDQGSLESLVTSEWYDDGICAWDQLEE